MTTLLTDCLTGDTREDCTGDATGWRAIPRRAATHTEVVGGHSTGLARRVIGGALIVVATAMVLELGRRRASA